MTRARITRFIAATGALVGAGALILQFMLIVQVLASMGYGPVVAVWIYFSYLTMFVNLFAFAILMRGAISPHNHARWTGERALLCVAATLVVGGFVYTILMRPILNPQGLQNLADILLHHVTPVLFVAYFLMRGAGDLRWRDAWRALILPVAYCIYALARGRLDGWYPYAFLDPQKLSMEQLAINILALGLAYWLCALGLIWLARKSTAAIRRA
jgi:hypothetical protein